MAFAAKKIKVIITLKPKTDLAGNPLSAETFAGTGGANQVTLEGYRMSASIEKAGQNVRGNLRLRIYGLSLKLMNQLSTLGRLPKIISRNSISVLVGDAASGITDVFDGTIQQAFTDLNNAPDAIFDLTAFAGMFEGLKLTTVTSFQGAVDVVVIMSSIANKMGLPNGFVNGFGGLSGIVINNPYYSGDPNTQADTVAKATGIRWTVDNNALCIWPAGGSRPSGTVPLISPETGLIGYPFPSGDGRLGLRTVFNPGVTFGSLIKVNSSITPANNLWTVVSLNSTLETELPNGKWESTIIGAPPDYLVNQLL